jgi:hypothetical protein
MMVGCQSTPRPVKPDAQLPVPQNSKQAPSDNSGSTGITNTDPTIVLTLAQRERDLNRTLKQAEQQLAAGATDRALGLLNAVEYYGLSESAVARLHLLRAKSYAQADNYFTAYQALGSIELTTNEHWSLLQKICSQLSFPRCRANSLIAIQATNIRSSQLQQDDILHALLDAQRAPDYEDLQLATAQITPIPEPVSQTHRGWHALGRHTDHQRLSQTDSSELAALANTMAKSSRGSYSTHFDGTTRGPCQHICRINVATYRTLE